MSLLRDAILHAFEHVSACKRLPFKARSDIGAYHGSFWHRNEYLLKKSVVCGLLAHSGR